MDRYPVIGEIKISGFKSIRELTLPLGRLNVLIGANGAGKSNFISIFSLLDAMTSKRLGRYVLERGGADSLLFYGRNVTKELKIAFTFGDNKKPAQPSASADFTGFDSYHYMCALKPDDNDSLFFDVEHCPVFEGGTIRSLTGAGKEMQLAEWTNTNPVARDIWRNLRDIKVFHFQDTSESAPMKKSSALLINNVVLRPDCENIAAFLYFLKKNNGKNYQHIVSVIKMAAPFFADFSFGDITENTRNVRLEWQDISSDKYFNANTLSDGTLRFICLATLLLQPKPPSVIILDEPELGLHPAAITLLSEMLESASQKSQIIVSTQSVTLINNFEPENIIVAERELKTGASVFKRLDREKIEQWLEDYSLGEVWEKNIIGGRP